MRFHIASYVDEIRPLNCAMGAGASLIAIFVSQSTLTYVVLGPAVLAFLAVFLVTAGGNVINDYFDVDIDRINKPHRALPRGLITRSHALLYSIILLCLGIVASLLINPICFAIAALNSILLPVYSWRFKRSALAGNLLVGYLTGSVFLFGGAAVFAFFIPSVLFASAVFAITSREIIKDVEDLRGDQRAGASTLPIRYGISLSLRTAALSMLAAIAFSPLPFILSEFGYVYLCIVGVADAILLYAVAASWTAPVLSSRIIKYGMILVLVAYIVGRV